MELYKQRATRKTWGHSCELHPIVLSMPAAMLLLTLALVFPSTGMAGEVNKDSQQIDINIVASGSWNGSDNESHYGSGTYTLYKNGLLAFEGVGECNLWFQLPSAEDFASVKQIRFGEGITSICVSHSGGCFSNLAEVSLPSTLESLKTDVFQNCALLAEVTFPNNLKEIGDDAFRGCTSLQQLSFPGSLETLGNNAFRDCTALYEVSFSEGFRYLGGDTSSEGERVWGNAAFSGCTSLQLVSLPNTIKTIGDSVFQDCTTLKEISLPEGLESIGRNAFKGSGIQSMVLPESLNGLQPSWINNCDNLLSVRFLGQCPENLYSGFYSGDPYSGKPIKAIHRAHDKSWDIANKYNLIGFTWYTLNDNGTTSEDDYVSPYFCTEMDVTAGTESHISGWPLYGKNDAVSKSFSVATNEPVKIHWSVDFDSDCQNSSFTITCKSTKGNTGAVIAEWRVDTGDPTSGIKEMDLASGNYVVETRYSDTHGNSQGSIHLCRIACASFEDVTPEVAHSADISWLATKGITTGFPDGTFRPYADVARADMAAFLYRLAGSPEYEAPAFSPFGDVDSSTAHYKEVCWLAEAGISQGWSADGGREFRPYATVARADMAAFLHRMSDYGLLAQ